MDNNPLDPSADELAAARMHVQALTDCGLPREALLRALLEQYDANAQPALSPGHDAQLAYNSPSMSGGSTVAAGPAPALGGPVTTARHTHAPRLSVSTTNSASTGRVSHMSTLSTVSAATTVSSVSSHSSRFSQTPSLAPSRPVATTRAYWCTSCETKFMRKFDWKRHEDEFHERYKKYPCPDCNRVFWGSNTFNQHHKARHGCKTCPHADSVIKYTRKKRAWGCGFCAAFLPTSDRYYDHVCLHFEAGRTKAHWYHSNVIYGLLHQPGVTDAWKELLNAHHGHLPKDQRPGFYWDAKLTGRAQGFLENEEPGQLQDLLEFFNPSRDDPQVLVQLAFDRALVTDCTTKSKDDSPRPVTVSGQPRQLSLAPREVPTIAMDSWSTTGVDVQATSNDPRASAVPLPLFSLPQPPPMDQQSLHVFATMPAGMPPMPAIPPQSQPQPQPQAIPQPQPTSQVQPQPSHSHPHSLSQPQQQLGSPTVGVLSFMSGNEAFISTSMFEDWNSMATTMVDERFAPPPSQPTTTDWTMSGTGP